MEPVIPLVLAGLAVLLAWVAPALMARQKLFRRAPRASLVAWQAVTLGGIIAAVAVPLAALPLLLDGASPTDQLDLVVPAVLASTAVLGRLLYAGHDVGSKLRRVRRDHRQLVDIIGPRRRPRPGPGPRPPDAHRLLHPGRQSRVVLSQGVLDELPDDQLEAVIAHEDAHLRGRHDLLLEFFAVVHRRSPGRCARTPPWPRCACWSRRSPTGPPCAAAARWRRPGRCVALAGSRTPDAASAPAPPAPVRLRLLADGPAHPARAVVAYSYAVGAGDARPSCCSLVAWT